MSVLFINLDPGKHTGANEKQSLLQQSFDVVYPTLTKFDGISIHKLCQSMVCFICNTSLSLTHFQAH